jgi:hypothetical protein
MPLGVIISKRDPHRSEQRAAMLIAGGAGVIGLTAALLYARAGLTLSHYDAKAHLVVARRIFDSLTPGWEQIGAVWLPLPHLLNAIPVQVDAWYRSGASGVAISLAAFVLAAYAAARLVLGATASRAAAAAAVAAFALNPNLLYLQSTPMTEPLLIGLSLLGIALLHDWLESQDPARARQAGIALALACLTRYEAWAITGAAIALAAVALWSQPDGNEGSLTDSPSPVPSVGSGWRVARAVSRVAIYPVAAVVLFLLLSRATIGEWFVTGGFFVPDNFVQGKPLLVAVQVGWGLRRLSGAGLLVAAALGAGLVLWRAASSRGAAAPLIVTFAPAAAALLPAYAFLNGHPFRIRYMVPLIVASAVCAGIGVGLLRRGRLTAAVALVLVTAAQSRPWDQNAPMITEARWDGPWSTRRQAVTACLGPRDARDKILISMGSLAHYMQETSKVGLRIADFIHEGNGSFWTEALMHPERHAGWILIEEQAEGGDVLAARARTIPSFLERFDRVCEGGGVALYRRHADPPGDVLRSGR